MSDANKISTVVVAREFSPRRSRARIMENGGREIRRTHREQLDRSYPIVKSLFVLRDVRGFEEISQDRNYATG